MTDCKINKPQNKNVFQENPEQQQKQQQQQQQQKTRWPHFDDEINHRTMAIWPFCHTHKHYHLLYLLFIQTKQNDDNSNWISIYKLYSHTQT